MGYNLFSMFYFIKEKSLAKKVTVSCVLVVILILSYMFSF